MPRTPKLSPETQPPSGDRHPRLPKQINPCRNRTQAPQTSRRAVSRRLSSALLALLLASATLAWAVDKAPYRSVGFVKMPASVELGAVSAVTLDPRGGLYVLHRGEPPILVFDSAGKYKHGWGDGMFKVAHGLRADRDGNIWTTDNGSHVIRKFTPDGKLLLTLGEFDVPGADKKHFRSPDDLVFSSTGEIFVADAGNGRIVRLSAEGKWLAEWGKKGTAPGEFQLAHSIAIDGGDRIYVGDRGNDRVQVFEPNGKLADVWSGFGNPFGVQVVGEHLLVSEGDVNKMIQLDMKGNVTGTWGKPGDIELPHLMAIGPDQTLYVAEVNGRRVQKFRPQ
jgi:DNA-binding beta-propeller fold protein YncE